MQNCNYKRLFDFTLVAAGLITVYPLISAVKMVVSFFYPSVHIDSESMGFLMLGLTFASIVVLVMGIICAVKTKNKLFIPLLIGIVLTDTFLYYFLWLEDFLCTPLFPLFVYFMIAVLFVEKKRKDNIL